MAQVPLPLRLAADAALAAIRGFAADQRGGITIESVLILPLFTYWYIGTFVFFDLFRMASINEKAAYAVSDAISRSPPGEALQDPDFEGYNSLFDYLVSNRGTSRMRVTSIVYNSGAARYDREWSVGTRGVVALTAEEVNLLGPSLPVMGGGETVVLVETFLDYTPPMNIGLPARQFRTFIFTRPRLAIRVCYVACPT